MHSLLALAPLTSRRARGAMAWAPGKPRRFGGSSCASWIACPPSQGARRSLWWEISTVCTQPKRSTSGWQLPRAVRCCGCRRMVPEPTPWHGPWAMSTTSGHGTTNGNADARWSARSSVTSARTDRGAPSCRSSMRPPRSRLLSRASRPSNTPRWPREGTNLMHSDLEPDGRLHYLDDDYTRP